KSSINKLRKNIDKSFIQLEEYHKSAILMPVMNTKRYPISELRLLGTLKKMLERSNKWEKLAGVLIINSGIDTKQDRSFFIQNPNFKKNAILDKFDLINVNKMESELMDRSLNPILADQFLEGKEKDWIDNQPQMEIKQDNLYIGRDFFHKLPQNTIAYGFKTPTDQGFYLLKNH
ncbi:MAG: hypothetical protein GPJ54_12690, partial [Candidatus Heimdallarchaeota archaeon]|nr:hypothetical protein [Candidatus Heimdallarchaeota archaeon]